MIYLLETLKMIYLLETLTLIIDQPVFCNINLMCPRFKRSTEGGRALALRATKEWNKFIMVIELSGVQFGLKSYT